MPSPRTQQNGLKGSTDTTLFYLYLWLPQLRATSRFENSPRPNVKTKWMTRQITSSSTALTSDRNSITDYTLNNLKSFKIHDGGNLVTLSHPAKYIPRWKRQAEQQLPGGQQMDKTEFDCQRCYCICTPCWVSWLGPHALAFKMGLAIHVSQKCVCFCIWWVFQRWLVHQPVEDSFRKGASKEAKCN